MRVGIIFLLSAIITAIEVVLVLGIARDPLPPVICAVMSFPVWIITFALLTRKFSGEVNIMELQNYANISQIRRNTDRIK